MCVGGGPSVPTMPQRQVAKLPDAGATAPRTDDTLSRKRALWATIMTSPSGLGNPASTTNTSTTLG